ncbi:MAG TPA: DoxX family protein [Herpetosiphonaceae bacterium]
MKNEQTMGLGAPAVSTSAWALWGGRALSGLAILFLAMDGIVKLFAPAPVVESFVQMGYPAEVAFGLGVVLLVCVAAYAIPRTAVLGAILLTGYLGGAVSAHVRMGGPVFSLAFPILMGAMVWGGLYLRDRRLRALLPLTS